jgi:hypothetical protein
LQALQVGRREFFGAERIFLFSLGHFLKGGSIQKMHLSSETALDFIGGRMAKDEESFWQRHLETCNQCTEDVGLWRQLETDLKRSHLKSISYEVLNKVTGFFPYRRDESHSSLRSVIATLIFDSFRQPALAGARGSAASARQLVMRAEEFDIHIKVWGDPDSRQILGQLLPRNGQNFLRVARFHLLRNGERVESTAVDEIGEFHFTDVPEGDLSLQIDLPNLTVIGALNIREG